MIRTMHNYSFVNEDGAMVDPTRKRKGRLFLYGRYTEWRVLFAESENHLTSAVVEVTEEGEFVTKNGSSYRLGEISPDYKDFLEVTKRGIKVVANWNIYGSRERGYCLTADMFPERKAMGTAKILAQTGNLLTIRRLVKIPAGETIWGEPEQVFVCWNAMSHQVELEIKTRGKVADIPYMTFRKFNKIPCKPLLFGETNNP